MIDRRSKFQGLFLAAAVVAASLSFGAGSASAVVLYFEDFEDEMLAPNTTINEGEVIGGVGSFNDDLTTDKSVFNVVQNFDAPVMTFSFDVVEPVVPLGDMTQSELMFRAGRGTGTSSIGSADDIVELILHRDDGNRGGYLNNGNESVFVVVNNSAGSLNISPAEGVDVTLENQQYVGFIRNNEDGMFVVARGPQNWLLPEPITRFFIGSGQNLDVDTFSIDNVLVVDEVLFGAVPPPAIPGDVNGDELVTTEDFDIIRENFRKSPRSRAQGDLTGDRLVSLVDFVEWKGAFLGGGGSPAGLEVDLLAVPEPGSLVLLMGATAILVGGRAALRVTSQLETRGARSG